MSTPEEKSYIRLSLINIYDKISKQETLCVGIELFRLLLKQNESEKQKILYMISCVGEQTRKLDGADKKELLALLPIFFQNPRMISYTPKILAIISESISFKTEPIFEYISNVFGEIVSIIGENQNANKYLLNFCFDLMNSLSQRFKKNNQICGCLFLSKYILNSPKIDTDSLRDVVSQINLHLSLFNTKSYTTKTEILGCLVKLIQKTKEEFKYANQIIEKLLEATPHISSSDWQSRKLVLDSFYYLLQYFKKDLREHYDSMISFAKECKGDKVKEVRIIALTVLKLIDVPSPKKKNNLAMSVQLKSQRENMCKDYNDRFVFVQKNFKGFEDVNEDSTISIKNKIDKLEIQMKKLERMQNELVKSVNVIDKELKGEYNSINHKLDEISELVEIKKNKSQNFFNEELDEEAKKSLSSDDMMQNFVISINTDDIKSISQGVIEDILSRLTFLASLDKEKEKNKDLINKIIKSYPNEKLKESTLLAVSEI